MPTQKPEAHFSSSRVWRNFASPPDLVHLSILLDRLDRRTLSREVSSEMEVDIRTFIRSRKNRYTERDTCEKSHVFFMVCLYPYGACQRS